VSVDWGAIAAHVRAVQAGARLRDEPVPPGEPAVAFDAVLRWRARASSLDQRLPHTDLARAASGGLQDSAPRAALLALHARIDGIGPTAWEDPDLAQLWFRAADYVVPRAALGVFTAGAMPRDPDAARALHDVADAVLAVLDGTSRPSREVFDRFPEVPNPALLRFVAPTGKVLLRWDASRIDLVPAAPAAVDPEEVRLELARTFLRWYGPARVGQFARWAGVTGADARTSWAALAGERQPVTVDGEPRSILAEQVDALRSAEPVRGVRLLPQGDPYLHADGQRLGPNRAGVGAVVGAVPDTPARVLNALTGRILVDGTIVGAWGRSGASVTLARWRSQRGRDRGPIEAEAESFAGPIGAPIRVRWLE
jgi:hypothetical protein